MADNEKCTVCAQITDDLKAEIDRLIAQNSELTQSRLIREGVRDALMYYQSADYRNNLADTHTQADDYDPNGQQGPDGGHRTVSDRHTNVPGATRPGTRPDTNTNTEEPNP
jgi:hypothetical protein